MARPSAALRLRDIDPKAFADEVVRLVTEHVSSLCMALSIDFEWRLPDGRHLHHEARMLAMYAQQGLIGDWAHHGNAADALVAVCAALYTCAGRPDVGVPMTSTWTPVTCPAS